MVKYDGDDDAEEYSLYQIKDMFKAVVTVKPTTAAPPAPAVQETAVAAPPAQETAVAAPSATAAAESVVDDATDVITANIVNVVVKERFVIDLTTVKKSNKVAESLYSLLLRQTQATTENRGEITATFTNEGKRMKVIFVENIDEDSM
jgi:hypothetical protein